MQVVDMTEFGPPSVLGLGVRDQVAAGTGEVLIQVHASGINRPDVLQRTGAYPPPAGASDVLGLEVAGVIVAGDEASMALAGFKLGDAVCALVAGGGYAQWCVAPIGQCLPVPKGLDMVQAASLPETFFTVWSNLFDRAALAAGETVLIQGGSSGIGVTAIQMAKAFGATVIVTAGSADKCQACKALGADHAINYREADFAQQVMQITNGKGVDVVLDMVAGDYVAREVSCMADDGRLVIIAVQGGINASFNAGLVLRKRLHITGSTLRARSVAFKSSIAAKLREHVWPKLQAGAIKPVLFKTFPASEASAAHTLMESNAHVGKIVLTWPVDL